MKDPRERHVVCKLDRYDLEDKYLRLLDEVNNLKKLSNNQEDKIKRLATKLMRFGANPRGCIAAVQLTEYPDKLAILEAENAKLREKICLLRNQLGNSKLFKRSMSTGRKPSAPPSTTGPSTCRSESSRLQPSSCHCINTRQENEAHEENDAQNYVLKIEELEAEKKELLSRIQELENEVACYSSGKRREKVADNVEYIRIWRQMKQETEKLAAAQEANEVLHEQVCQLKNLLKESCKNYQDVKAELASLRRQSGNKDESMSKTQIDLREKDERIMDLTNEMHILQQHNRELLELSSKFGKVELENAELKRKVAEQLSEQQALKDTLSKEGANVTALQAANDELLAKLHELQKNIDVMTIKLMGQSEPQTEDAAKPTEKTTDSVSSKSTATSNAEFSKESSKVCKRNCNGSRIKARQHERESQTSGELYANQITQTHDQLDSAKSKDIVPIENNGKNKNNIQQPNNGNSLSREGMLKLLEEVQISTPLESRNASRIRQAEKSSESSVSRRKSQLETLLFGDSAL